MASTKRFVHAVFLVTASTVAEHEVYAGTQGAEVHGAILLEELNQNTEAVVMGRLSVVGKAVGGLPVERRRCEGKP